jgi:hypothetical protein
MTHLAAHLPAAVVADLLNFSPGAAVRWIREAGADWTRYAAELVQDRDPKTCRMRTCAGAGPSSIRQGPKSALYQLEYGHSTAHRAGHRGAQSH